MLTISNATFETGSVSISFVLPDLDPIVAAIADLGAKIDSLTTQENLILSNQTSIGDKVMALVDDLEAKVTSVQGTEASVVTLLHSIHDELVAANANNPRVQAVIDMLSQGQQKMVDAVTANPDPGAAPPPGP